MEILYEDAHLIVVIKPGGLLSVPGRGKDKQDCLTSRLQALFPDMPEQPAVHRLDMSTSGLMVVSRTKTAHRLLSRQFELRQVKKAYDAVISGKIEEEQGTIRLAFRLDPNNRPLQIYDPKRGKLGVTRWQKLGSHQAGTRLRFFPETGRTHQLRVHAAHPLGLGCPIVGDSLYGQGCEGDQLFLHATELGFTHPKTSEKMQFFSSPPF